MDDLSNPAETPRADPHAGCCGGWGLNTPGYPIRPCLDRQDEPKPIVNFGEQSRVESSDSFGEKRLAHGDDLRNICDGRFRKAGSLDREANVSRSVGQAQVRRNDGRNNRTDAAVIEAIC